MSMDFEAIRKRLEEELYPAVQAEISSPEREEYEKHLVEWQCRYRAQRSIKGLMTTGVEDPESCPLEDPFPGAADFGTPIEMSIVQELVPNVMSASGLGMRPYTESTIIDARGQQPAGQVDDFVTFMLDRCGIRKIRRQTVLNAYKFGESVEKLICEPQTRSVTEERRFLVSGNPKKGGKILMDAVGEPIEVLPDEDLKLLMLQQMTGEDPRSQFFRYAQRVLGLDEHSALEAAGVEVGEDWVRMAELEQVNGPQAPPAANWDKATRYEIQDVEVSEDVTVNQWPQIVPVHPKDFIVPSDADSNDLMEYWNCHRYREPLSWLLDRIGDGHGEGFYEDVVDSIVDKFKERRKDDKKAQEEEQPEIYEVYTRWALEVEDEESDEYYRETEIVAWFSPDNEEKPLLGWMVNPAVRFQMHHIRPFFLYQVKPEANQYHGLSVPETATGTRNMLDWLANNELNYEAVSKFPPILQSPNCFKYEQNQHFGIGQRWVKEVGEVLELLNYPRTSGTGFVMHEMLTRILRMMWGSNEQMSGHMTKTDSGTAAEAQLLAARGSQMFQDTVESLAQTFDTMLEYLKNFYLFSDVRDLVVPNLRDKKRPDALAISSTRKLLAGPLVIKSRRVMTEAEREVKMRSYQMALEFLAKTQNPLLQDPSFVNQIMTALFDALNLENIEIPSPQQMMQAQAMIQKQAQEMVVKERYQKALESVQNKGMRKGIESFLERNAPGQIPGQVPDSQAVMPPPVAV